MKTIRTTNGIKKINETDSALITVRVRNIIQDQRTFLIDNLLQGDLNSYIIYISELKLTPLQLKLVRSRLIDLKESTVNLSKYASVVKAVQINDYFQLDNVFIYTEIDTVISTCFDQHELFDPLLRSHVF